MKRVLIFIFFLGILGGSKAQEVKPDTFITYQRIAFDFGLHWRSYGRPASETMESAIMNWEQSRALGFNLNLNFTLDKNFNQPKFWIASAKFSTTILPVSGTLVLDEDLFNLAYTHRLNVQTMGTSTRFGFGMTRRQKMVKSDNYWFVGGQLGLSLLTYQFWQGDHLIDLPTGQQERQLTYAMGPAEASELQRTLDFSLHAGFYFKGPGLLDFELGLEALPFGAISSKITMTPFQESTTLVDVPLTYIGVYATAHILRKRRGQHFNETILKRHYSED